MTEGARRAARIAELFHEGVVLEPECLESWLAGLPDTPELIEELRHLIAADSAADLLLDRGLDDSIGALLAGSHDDMADRQFGPYRIVSLLGEG